MGDLLSSQTLAVWCQEDPATVQADPYAQELIATVSRYANWLAGRDGVTTDASGEILDPWEIATVPIDVHMVVLKVCKRAYENPTRVIQESVGPLGERVHEDQALGIEFTDEEIGVIVRHNPDGDPTGGDPRGLYTISIVDQDAVLTTSPLYVSDDQQIGLEMSTDPRPWMIPMFSPGDPGGDENYG